MQQHAMPRNFALKSTSAHPRDTGSLVPYLDSFWALLKPAEHPTKTCDLLNSYLDYIYIRTGSNNLFAQASSGFRRAFKKLATNKKIRECTYPRGYYVKVPKITRKKLLDSEPVHCNQTSIKFERKFIDKKNGYGMFAKNDIPVNSTLVEYMGEWITEEEHIKRDKVYEREKLPPVAVYDPKSKLYLDGNRNMQGILFEFGENDARYFNHSKTFPNCKLIQNSKGKLYLVTITDIPKGLEITWDYGDRQKESVKDNSWLCL